MRLRILSTLLFMSVALLSVASDKITVTNVHTSSKPIEVRFPLLLDSVNIKGEKFENKTMLEYPVSKGLKLNEPLKAGIGEFFQLRKAKSDALFHLLQFDFTTDKYSKVKIKVKAPSMFELYVNDKKETSKTSVEDSVINAKSAEATITSNPQTNTVLVKYLSFASNLSPEQLKIEVEALDSTATIEINPKGQRLLINDIMEGKRITSTSISPDGQFVLINYKDVAKGGKVTTSAELYDVKAKTTKILLASSKILGWTPKTSKLYFMQLDEGITNLMLLDPKTMVESILVEGIPSESFYFMPDEKSLIYREKESMPESKGDLKLLRAMEDRQAGYGDRYLLSIYNLENGVKQRLTYGKSSTEINDISSDARYILYTTSELTPTERPFSATSMYILDMQTLKVDTVFVNEKFISNGKFSPDMKSLLLFGSAEAFDGISLDIKEGQISNTYDGRAFIMNIKSKEVEPFSKTFTPSIGTGYWNLADGKIYLQTVDHDYENVYSYNPKNKQFEKLPLNEDVIRRISLADNTTLASYFGLSAQNTTQAYLVDLSTNKSTLISAPLAEKFKGIELGEMKDWNFTSSDGTTIEGRYYLPPNFDPAKKYPMIVYYYGGTTPTARALDHPYSMPVYAAMGYVVYTLQPSGTIGFGQEFSARHVNAWGKRTADDIIEGTKKFIADHSFVDESKVGCIGASYGGFMTMYLQTQTDIFAAAVSHAGISALSSYWGEGFWGYSYSSGASAFSYPWNNKDLYVEQSPLFHADKINTPLLLLHGMDDTNVPIGESIQMYTALQILGKPVEFIQVKGENHGIADYKRRLEWNHSIYAWFAKWLKSDSAWWDSLYKEDKK